ncbi:SMC5-SMC6 complex localization factor protein 2 [Aulostomus maculatus]
MRKRTEHQGHTRKLSEYFSPKGKVKDPALKQSPHSHVTSETPMKPSQVPNRLLHCPPRRMLPLQSPQLSQKDRPSSPQQPPHPRGSVNLSLSHPVRKPQLPQEERLASPHSVHHRSPVRSPQDVPTTIGTSDYKSQNRSPSTPDSASSSRRKDVSNHSHSPYTKRDHVTKSATTSDSGRCHSTIQRQDSTKDKQLVRSSSSEKPVDCSSQKRRRHSEDCNTTPKKLCVQHSNSNSTQTPTLVVDTPGSTSLVPQPSSRQPLDLKLLPNLTDISTKSACSPFSCSGSSTMFRHTHPSSTSSSSKPSVKRSLSTEEHQPVIHSSESKPLSKPGGELMKKRTKENDKRDKSYPAFSSRVDQKPAGHSPRVHSSHHSGCAWHHNTSDLTVKTLSGTKQEDETRNSDRALHKSASKSTSRSSNTVEWNKSSRQRQPDLIPDNQDELFTPDPMTCNIKHNQKTAKPRIEQEPTRETSLCSPSSVLADLKAKDSPETDSPRPRNTKALLSPAHHSQIPLPTVSSTRRKLDSQVSHCSTDSPFKNSPITSCSYSLSSTSSPSLSSKEEDTKDKYKSLHAKTVISCAPKHPSTSPCLPSPHFERRASQDDRKRGKEVDPMDVELDLGLSFALVSDLNQGSHSDEEELLSLQEMMQESATKRQDTSEKGPYSEPSTPGHHSCQPKAQSYASPTKTSNYKNSLDQMLKDIQTNKKAKENETHLFTACQEQLLRIMEYEQAEENQEEGISPDQQEFLQRYLLTSSAIRDVPPGEAVFNLERFGQIFNQETLQLRQCLVKPQGAAQKTLLWSSPAQLRLHVNIGLFQEAYDSRSPCPTQVTRFLFKMMSVHKERIVSEKILQVLYDIASMAAYQIVKNGSQEFKVWVPALADVTLVLMNMGVGFVTLFPFENIQPLFKEGDLLDDIYITSESPSSNTDLNDFPEHNWYNILRYLSYCMGFCTRAYSDDELLLLLTVVARVGLDSRLILQSSVELYTLQYKIVNNIRDWDTMLPRMCMALTGLTDDHHNMCLLVQRLPDHTRGKQLRQHLSLSMISKLLDGTCKYKATEKDFQLSDLRLYLPHMQPSSLLRAMLNSSARNQNDKEDDPVALDQQAYYLCYSLLTLTNEASNFQVFPAQQKDQLRNLGSELTMHVKCDIRESQKCLYRSKVKDLVARIDTNWQMLLQRTKPLHDKLYDSW